MKDHWLKSGEITANEAERHLHALANFDGNPQGMRIITRLQWFYDHYGMNLTCPLLAAYTKYIGSRATTSAGFTVKVVGRSGPGQSCTQIPSESLIAATEGERWLSANLKTAGSDHSYGRHRARSAPAIQLRRLRAARYCNLRSERFRYSYNDLSPSLFESDFSKF